MNYSMRIDMKYIRCNNMIHTMTPETTPLRGKTRTSKTSTNGTSFYNFCTHLFDAFMLRRGKQATNPTTEFRSLKVPKLLVQFIYAFGSTKFCFQFGQVIRTIKATIKCKRFSQKERTFIRKILRGYLRAKKRTWRNSKFRGYLGGRQTSKGKIRKV